VELAFGVQIVQQFRFAGEAALVMRTTMGHLQQNALLHVERFIHNRRAEDRQRTHHLNITEAITIT
jgi:hypothetical protein